MYTEWGQTTWGSSASSGSIKKTEYRIFARHRRNPSSKVIFTFRSVELSQTGENSLKG